MTPLLLLYSVIVVSFTLRILLRDDLSPPARLAWFIILVVLPYIGSAVYFLFGEIDLGNRANKRHKEVFDEIRTKAVSYMGRLGATDDLIEPPYRPAFKYAGSINGFHPVDGNSADLMANSEDTNASLIADIDGARQRVHVQHYIWLGDQTGTKIAQALIRAAKRGVVCRAIADGLGSRAFIKSAIWSQMKRAGVQTAVALPLNNPILTLLTSRIDLRNHRKITVIDGKISYCGSRNAADPEFLIKAKYAPWIDIMFRFEGPVVAQNELLFLSDWMQATGEHFHGFGLNAQPVKGGFPAQAIGDGPNERRGATPQLFANLFAGALNEISISTPYFVPDASVLEGLCSAAYRGVKVALIFPKVNDSWIVAAASRSYYRKLLTAGCEIYEFKDGLLHAKTLTIDGQITLIGSSNLDLRSFDLNYENNILLQNPALTQAVHKRQCSYIDRSDIIVLDQVLAWRPLPRIWNNVIATIGPVL